MQTFNLLSRYASVIRFVALTEYTVFPGSSSPFAAGSLCISLIGVSYTAVQVGMSFASSICMPNLNSTFKGIVDTAARTILENLDRIPDKDIHTKITIMCYDVFSISSP